MANHISDKGYVSGIDKELLLLNNKRQIAHHKKQANLHQSITPFEPWKGKKCKIPKVKGRKRGREGRRKEATQKKKGTNETMRQLQQVPNNPAPSRLRTTYAFNLVTSHVNPTPTTNGKS